MYSKSKIDDAGKALSHGKFKSDDHEIEAELVFDEFRRSHLQPLTEATLRIQSWLSSFDRDYYVAQRLKRKPQILRKLRRFSVRLTQLQDIGGNRIIVEKNEDVDRLRRFINAQIEAQDDLVLLRETDYRPYGRDDTGYRALHMILKSKDAVLELQVRSRAQHYWAECIERTSVIYGQHLKENEGHPDVLLYFKTLSRIFFEIESRREPSFQDKMALDDLRSRAEQIISQSSSNEILHGHVNDDILHILTEVQEKKPDTINNWILIFDWNSGHFVDWKIISRNPVEAYSAYVHAENQYSAIGGFEVVLVGASDVSTIRRTHSHYFGISGYDSVLESLDQSIIGFSSRKSLDSGSRRILHALMRKRYWGSKTVSISTLKNHYCKSVFGIELLLQNLVRLGLINDNANGSISLNQSKRDEIQGYL